MQNELIRTVTLRQVIKVWWAIIWRVVVHGVFGGTALGLLAGLTLKIGEQGGGHTQTIAIYCGLCATLPAGIWGVRAALKKKYRNFRINIVKL